MCTMSLTLGRDIGIVMAKGVFLGVVCTITILPALLMTFDKALRFTHRTFIPRLSRVSHFVVKRSDSYSGGFPYHLYSLCGGTG